MFGPRRLAFWTVTCAVMAGAACYSEVDDPPTVFVGPAPLRRLSNDQYLNALRDLFPTQNPPLPPLPKDTASSGFENAVDAQQPSDVRVSRYETIANLYAAGATTDTAAVAALVGCSDWSTPSLAASCSTSFIEKTGARVFRRPLSAAERDRFAVRFRNWHTSIDFEAAVRLTLSTMLQSPQFVYRPEPRPEGEQAPKTPTVRLVEPYAMASRLSFFLWESVPDDILLDAASRGELTTPEQLRAQATRMLADERARRVFWNFHRQWLSLDRVLGDEHFVRTPEVDPGWTAETPIAATQESRLFVENILAANGSLHDILTSRHAWVNGEMARLYGVAPPSDPTTWAEVDLPEGERAGLLSRVAFLAGYAHRGATSPPIRGNGVQLRLLCRMPTSPPPGVDLSQPKPDPAKGPQTNRMLFEERTAPTSCQGCHIGLNGLGFGFEHYNAAGRWQTTEQGLPIDAHGALHGTDVDRPFDGVVDLSAGLNESVEVHRCATRQWMRYALGREVSSEEATFSKKATENFVESGGNVRALLLEIVTSPTFRMQRVDRVEGKN